MASATRLCFLDTNILIYAALRDPSDHRKFQIARGILASENFCLSAQVLAEFYVNTAIKPKVPISAWEADRWVSLLCSFPVLPLDGTLVEAGIALARRYRIHYYDAAILAAAERLGAPILYTEDLNDGQQYGSVLVENPFRGL
jgi:predicted nucleic acid-binding protein